jgi:glycosyltransferase involved in cell wall biosynthesis
MKSLKIIYLVSEDWYFVSHRLKLAQELVKQGHEVILVSNIGSCRDIIESSGIRIVNLQLNRRSLNPFIFIYELLLLASIYLSEKPDVVHHVALRSVMLGGITARICRIRRVVNAVTGMGFLFTGKQRNPLARRLLERAIPFAMSRSIVIVQNSDDAHLLRELGVPEAGLKIIPGAGVDTERFAPGPRENALPIVMAAARLLRDKGIGEFVEAARSLQGQGMRFVLVGMIDKDNPSSIPEDEVTGWVEKGYVEWWGHSSDMPETLKKADIFCLPSYREGIPKGLIEAMSTGIACITTDAPGCRETLIHGESGLIVPVKDSASLAEAILKLVQDPELRKRLGEQARARSISVFDDRKIIQATIETYTAD